MLSPNFEIPNSKDLGWLLESRKLGNDGRSHATIEDAQQQLSSDIKYVVLTSEYIGVIGARLAQVRPLSSRNLVAEWSGYSYIWIDDPLEFESLPFQIDPLVLDS